MSSTRRPNSLHLDHHRTRDDKEEYKEGGGCHSAPTTPCSITRRTPSRPFRRASAPRTLCPLERTPNKAAQLHIEAQLERKTNLEKELEKDKKKLEVMQKRTEELRARLATKKSSLKTALAEEIAALQAECTKLCSELDYIPEGCNAKTSIDLIGAAGHSAGGGERGEGPHWRCHICTFQNHPLLNQCESCTMPRIILEGTERPNIHIHVTHHKFPSCKVVHSWAI